MQAPLDKKIRQILVDPKEAKDLVQKMREATRNGESIFITSDNKKIRIKPVAKVNNSNG